MSVTQTRSQLELSHALRGCNAYCQGNRHSHVIWGVGNHHDADDLQALCTNIGVLFVDARRAPEAEPPTHRLSATWLDGTQAPSSHIQPDDEAWLVTYEVLP